MTSGELKFALRVETVLNTITQPEYRQLVVEALMVLTLVVEHNLVTYLGETIFVEQIVVSHCSLTMYIIGNYSKMYEKRAILL